MVFRDLRAGQIIPPELGPVGKIAKASVGDSKLVKIPPTDLTEKENTDHCINIIHKEHQPDKMTNGRFSKKVNDGFSNV